MPVKVAVSGSRNRTTEPSHMRNRYVSEKQIWYIATLLTLGSLGCGPGGPEIARVEGTVKMDGKPLEDAAVVFIPENGRPAGARTDKDGHYVLNFSEGRRGAIPGKSSIRMTTDREASEGADGKPIPDAPETILMKYNTQSTLEFTVVTC